MRVAFDLLVPIVHPTSHVCVWQDVTIMHDWLDLSSEEVFDIVRGIILFSPHGHTGTIMQLAETLRLLANDKPALIVWGKSVTSDLPLRVDVRVGINYESGKVYAEDSEFTFKSVLHFKRFITAEYDYREKFLQSF